jgi:hypothetical protein
VTHFDVRLASVHDATPPTSIMCRNIRMLFNFAPPVTDDEIRARLAAVRAEDQRLQQAFEVQRGGLPRGGRRHRRDLGEALSSLETKAPPRYREVEAAKAGSALCSDTHAARAVTARTLACSPPIDRLPCPPPKRWNGSSRSSKRTPTPRRSSSSTRPTRRCRRTSRSRGSGATGSSQRAAHSRQGEDGQLALRASGVRQR